MIEAFLTGILFGVSTLLLAEMIGIAVYVRVKGAFTIGPPTQPLRGLLGKNLDT